MLNIYGFFHFNLAFSSIEEEAHSDIIEKCYLPLLDFIEQNNVPFGIELSGYTLEKINELCPEWVTKFKYLHKKGLVDLIGCGYAQIIGPLVPSKITEENLKIGNLIYKEYLAIEPKIALINEQAYSKSLADLYIESGYDSIIMEWNNPYKANNEWKKNWKFQPQHTISQNNKKITTIWNDTIAFQKFQRYIHGEVCLGEYISFIKSQNSENIRNFPIYGSDIEVINYRPGRFDTETKFKDGEEWIRMKNLFDELKELPEISLIKPSEVVSSHNSKNAYNLLNFTNAEYPIVVKKQPKYNISRWAVTGRNDININTRCWKTYEHLKKSHTYSILEWKELCYLWSSDFRTHITQKRWKAFEHRLSKFEESTFNKELKKLTPPSKKLLDDVVNDINDSDIRYEYQGNYLCISGDRITLKLNLKKGLAIYEFIDKKIDKNPIFGTIEHDYFDDIAWGVDFFSGHLVYEVPGAHKITDIHEVKPKIIHYKNAIKLESLTESRIGVLKKEIYIDDLSGEVSIKYLLPSHKALTGSLRYGYVTLFTENFDQSDLHYMSHNGGKDIEGFKIHNNFDHGEPVSKLVSSSNIIGATEGLLIIGDKNKKIHIEFDKSLCASVGMVQFKSIQGRHLIRAFLSARETDDTSKIADADLKEIKYTLKVTN
jgi:hypothetical protein